MLSKKAIAAFAAGATLVSGLALAVPALAESSNGNQNTKETLAEQRGKAFHDMFEANVKYVNALNKNVRVARMLLLLRNLRLLRRLLKVSSRNLKQ
ncbi:hypothetical protein HMPREF3208_00635 [Gardnerella vaginalis]|uniref:Uncharacterized protein n=1 Tax=Gardnerella vaginalis TaxID=2702 RepID=A0A133NXZ4_GARVA|nr:hypothetical protein [Gardnerella vaginalis]KXA21144.1 hypothetical protein HMPREF3208_00635 [Gardnerella vaginalis]